MRVSLELDHHGPSYFVVVCVSLDRAGRFPPDEAEGLRLLREADPPFLSRGLQATDLGDHFGVGSAP